MHVLLTRPEAAKRARISERTLDMRIAVGTGPAVCKIGRRTLISEAALAAWIEAQTVSPARTA